MNTLKDQLRADLTTAMKSRETIVVSTIRMALAAIKNAEVAGEEVITLDDAQVIAVLQAEAKKRTEAADIYTKAARLDTAATELAERSVLERYLPAALSAADIQAIVDEEVAVATAAGTSGPKAMGIVVKAVRERTGSGADGAQIAAAVKATLTI